MSRHRRLARAKRAAARIETRILDRVHRQEQRPSKGEPAANDLAPSATGHVRRKARPKAQHTGSISVEDVAALRSAGFRVTHPRVRSGTGSAIGHEPTDHRTQREAVSAAQTEFGTGVAVRDRIQGSPVAAPSTAGHVSPEVSEIRRIVEARGITCLVHFTRLQSLKRIIDDGAILSTRQLEAMGRRNVRNDDKRVDGHLGYVCCSITVPNKYVLREFREKNPANEWVVLYLSIESLCLSTTKFCPVNAAKDGGQHIGQGLDAFNSMFAEEVPSGRCWPRSQGRSPRNCPTDVQAEVMVRDRIPAHHIIRIGVDSNAIKATILPWLKRTRCEWSPPITVDRILQGTKPRPSASDFDDDLPF